MKFTKKTAWVVFALPAMLILFTGCGEADAGNTTDGPVVSVEGIALSETAEKTLPVGETFKMTATITPHDASDQRIIWKSLRSNVAMVFADGLNVIVMAITPGTTTIMAFTEDGGYMVSCPVTVPE